MTLDANGFIFYEDFIHEIWVPCGARGPTGGIVLAREEDLVRDCVAAFGDEGFGFAHC